MNLFNLNFEINNNLGKYSFLFLIILIILYFIKPRAIKKIVPSIIFLEKNDKKNKMFLFFKKFIKDFLFLLQFLIVLLLCMALLDITTNIFVNKINEDVVIVIDGSASSNTFYSSNTSYNKLYNNKILFDICKDIAKKKIGLKTSIILAKNKPELLARDTNPISARNIINNLKPSESLSNIYDSMIFASNIIKKGKIIVISDFIDSNEKDIITAKKIIEAKSIKVELVNPRIDNIINNYKIIDNIGIIDYKLKGNNLIIQLKNFGNQEKEITYKNEKIFIEPYSIVEHSITLDKEKNEIKFNTNDNLKVDDSLYIMLPKKSENSVLIITNKKKSFIKSAFESINFVNLKIQEPPIINIENQKIIILDNVNYDIILPGTIEKIKESIEKGSTLIITAQEDLNINKLNDLLALDLDFQKQEVGIYNTNNIKEFVDFNFGLSKKYFKSNLKNNNSIVIAEANDKFNSPVIVLTKYNKGNILFYGIIDEDNQFRNSPQYPLFWIQFLNYVNAKNFKLNYKIGDIIYGKNILRPDKKIVNDYLTFEKTGFYKIDDIEVGVNLLNIIESDINNLNIENINLNEYENKIEKTKQKVSLIYLFVFLIILLSFLEIYILKKRGDI